jgi:hypothetical protein
LFTVDGIELFVAAPFGGAAGVIGAWEFIVGRPAGGCGAIVGGEISLGPWLSITWPLHDAQPPVS